MSASAAAGLLRDPKTSAIALLEAMRRLLGDFLAWEPESMWLELERHGIDLPGGNRAKVMAGVTLHLMPSFYWDGIVFEKTAIALDGVEPNPDILEEASPASLAWAVVESRWILRPHPAWEFGHEPRAYAGVVMARAGFVVAPDELAFAQRALDRERHDDELRDEVAERWSKIDKASLSSLALEENRLDVQIARLAAVELHVRDRRSAAERELAGLG